MKPMLPIMLTTIAIFAATGQRASAGDTAAEAIAPIAAFDTDAKAFSDSAVDTDSAAVMAVPPPAPVAPPLLRKEIDAKRMPTIEVTLTPETPAVGDLITWKLVALRQPSDRIVLPSALDFGSLEIADKNATTTDEDKGRAREQIEVQLIAFEPGDFDVPPQKLTIVNEAGNISEVMTPAFHVTVTSLIANEPEPKLKADAGPGVEVWEDDYTLVYVGAAILGAILIVLLTLLVRKLWARRRPKPAPPPPPPRPADEVALEKLGALESSSYLADGQHKEFHLLLSEAVREYLGNRYGFDSLEMSTEELKQILAHRDIPMTIGVDIRTLLEDTDLVKFARYVPEVAESIRLLAEAVRLVHVTAYRAPSAASATGGVSPLGGGENA